MKKVIVLVVLGMLIVLSLFFLVIFIQGGSFPSLTSKIIKGNENPLNDTKPIVLSSYQCDKNIYDCYDFKSQYEAQKVYESCGDLFNDVHHLDRDSDGMACESLLKYN